MVELTDRDAVVASPAAPMSERSKTGVTVLATALGVGVLGNLLLRATPWGINVLLWCAVLMVATLGVVRIRDTSVRGEGRWMFIPVLLFAAFWAWRSSDTLVFLDLLAVLVALALMAYRTTKGRLMLAGIADYLWSLFMAVTNATLGPLILALRDVEWNRIPRGKWTPILMAVVRGLLFAVPVLLVFGGLLMAADAVFENIMTNLFHFDVETLFSHAFLTVFWTWLAAGFLHETMAGDDNSLAEFKRPGFVRIGMIEAGIVLGTINVLFLAFVIVQFRYFFGGEPFGDLSYSEYARRGFSELVVVAALLLPLLLGIHWLLGNRLEGRPMRLFQGLAGGSVAMIFVMIASALQRMLLYIEAYGLTELRLYTIAFMGWLAVLFVWFILTVLRGQRDRFVFGALVTSFVAIAGLHIANPDALIAATNITRAGSLNASDTSRYRAEFDNYYVTTLSADAVPTILAALPALPNEDRCVIARQLIDQWSSPTTVDWRTWNYGRWLAWQSVDANMGNLQTWSCGRTDS